MTWLNIELILIQLVGCFAKLCRIHPVERSACMSASFSGLQQLFKADTCCTCRQANITSNVKHLSANVSAHIRTCYWRRW